MISGLCSEAAVPFLCSTVPLYSLLALCMCVCVRERERKGENVCVTHIHWTSCPLPVIDNVPHYLCHFIWGFQGKLQAGTVCLLGIPANDGAQLPSLWHWPATHQPERQWAQPWHINIHIHLNTHAELLTQKKARSLGSLFLKFLNFLKAIPIKEL